MDVATVPVGGSSLGALLSCFGLTAGFVGSLYIWLQPLAADRDQPSVIKRRFLSVFLVCIASFLYLWLLSSKRSDVLAVLHSMGVRWSGLEAAAVIPLVLTMVLFAGPLYYEWLTMVERRSYFKALGALVSLLEEKSTSLIFWRNCIVGPFTEEWVFRACMCPLLLSGGFSFTQIVILCPCFFGAAHLHHITQHMHKQGTELKSAWAEVRYVPTQ